MCILKEKIRFTKHKKKHIQTVLGEHKLFPRDSESDILKKKIPKTFWSPSVDEDQGRNRVSPLCELTYFIYLVFYVIPSILSVIL